MSWVPVDPDSPFSIANIPFGIISHTPDGSHRPAIAIGRYVLDLAVFAADGGFASRPDIVEHISVFSQPTLNAFAAVGRPFHRLVRQFLMVILREDTTEPKILRDNHDRREKCLFNSSSVYNKLPLAIGDYTDFYAGLNHAHNVGVLFRGPQNALQPNYKHMPVAYHGRASSIVVSGMPIIRPWGQILIDPRAMPQKPILSHCAKLDIELELGMFICKSNPIGERIRVDDAEDHIFGYVLMNDWSARDVQAWEYVPLGPFTSKNLGTSISPWVVLADAAIPRTAGLENDTKLLSYLEEEKKDNILDIELEVDIISSSGLTKTITTTSSKNLLWSWPQMIAHHTITGCNLRPGDLFGSGTISGTEPGTEGSMLEQTKGGNIPIDLGGGEQRMYLKDGDTVVIRGWANKDKGASIGFGEVRGTIIQALPLL